MKPYKHFTQKDRENLQKYLAEGLSMRKIAILLDKSPSSVSREIKRSSAKHKKDHHDNTFCYNAWHAQTEAVRKRRNAPERAIKKNSEAWNFVIAGLKKYWSPECICAIWEIEHPDEKPLHYSTIYRYVRSRKFPGITRKKNLRRRGKRKVHRSSKFNTIHPERIIPDWEQVIKDRVRIGDWEGDTVYGGVGKGLLVTLVDRKSRYLRAALIESRDSTVTEQAIVRLLRGLPCYSISLDNGSEFSQFQKLEEDLNTLVYFAEPHKPWQRGTNENTNDLLRFYFPKGYDFHSLSQEELNEVVEQINNKPRKCLGWKTPKQVFESELVKSVALS